MLFLRCKTKKSRQFVKLLFSHPRLEELLTVRHQENLILILQLQILIRNNSHFPDNFLSFPSSQCPHYSTYFHLNISPDIQREATFSSIFCHVDKVQMQTLQFSNNLLLTFCSSIINFIISLTFCCGKNVQCFQSLYIRIFLLTNSRILNIFKQS